MSDGDCVFCRIVEGGIPADVVAQGEHVVAFRDVNPQAPTHVQVIPRKHVSGIDAFDPDADASWLVELFRVANEVASAEGLDRGYRLVINNGPLSGQSVPHVHLHVIGGRPLSWPPG